MKLRRRSWNPEAVELRCVDGPAEALLDIHPAGLPFGVHEDEALLLEPRGEGVERLALAPLRRALFPGTAAGPWRRTKRDGTAEDTHSMALPRCDTQQL
jgi:hypothetical protein